jgi:hypothetical protein
MEENHHKGGGVKCKGLELLSTPDTTANDGISVTVSRLSTGIPLEGHPRPTRVPLMDNRRTAAESDDATEVLTAVRTAGHTATLAVGAAGCGAMGCRLTEPLIRATVDGTTRTLCTDHALEYAGVDGGH